MCFLFLLLFCIIKITFALQEDHPDGCCGSPAGPVDGCLRWSLCPALPCLSPQTDTTVALIYKIPRT